MKKLSESAKLRLIRQGQKHIANLERRLVTCALDEFANVQAALFAERAAVKALMEA